MGELVRLFIEDANQGANMVRDDDSASSDVVTMFAIVCECKCEAPLIIVR